MKDYSHLDQIADVLKDGYLCPYIPLCCSKCVLDTGTESQKEGYYWKGKIVPREEVNEEFWAEVQREYPTIYVSGAEVKSLINQFQSLMKGIDEGEERKN